MSEERATYLSHPVISEAHQRIAEANAVSEHYAMVPDDLVRAGKPSALAVYAALDRIGKGNKTEVSTAVSYIAACCHLSTRTVKDALTWLEAEGFIQVIHVGRGREMNSYKLPFRESRWVKSTHQMGSQKTRWVESTHVMGEIYPQTNSINTNSLATGSFAPASEPVATPATDSFANASESVAAPKGAKQHKTEITDAFINTMHERFDPVFGHQGTEERIEEAIGHKSYAKYSDKQAYVRGWLRRDSENLGKTKNSARPSRAGPGNYHQRRIEAEKDLPRRKPERR